MTTATRNQNKIIRCALSSERNRWSSVISVPLACIQHSITCYWVLTHRKRSSIYSLEIILCKRGIRNTCNRICILRFEHGKLRRQVSRCDIVLLSFNHRKHQRQKHHTIDECKNNKR